MEVEESEQLSRPRNKDGGRRKKRAGKARAESTKFRGARFKRGNFITFPSFSNTTSSKTSFADYLKVINLIGPYLRHSSTSLLWIKFKCIAAMRATACSDDFLFFSKKEFLYVFPSTCN